jgi:hypothetical protein
MNGSALKLRRAVEKHKIIGLDTEPFIYYIDGLVRLSLALPPLAFSVLF